MKKIHIILISSFLILGLLSRCSKTDLTASYISIEPDAFEMNMTNFNLIHETNYDAEELASIASQKFPDVWVYVNGKSLGTWELPCEIPILETDSTIVEFYPGVKMNGISTSRPRYPFVKGCKIKLGLNAGETLQVNSIPFEYYPETNFELVENFEPDYNQYFESSDSAGVSFQRITDPDEPTNRIGVLALEDTITEFEIISTPLQLNHKVPSSVFLEMDYRCDSEETENFYVGMLIGTSTSSAITHEPLVGVNTSSKWKKIYINLTQSILRNQTTATSYRIIISGAKSGTNDIHLYFDNIKVVFL
ncbi:MAG TPA: hypothetical protein PK740_07680 [Bacteroidales bacterium]|nr:hypothetical protein [Bacteroidales bacterium]